MKALSKSPRDTKAIGQRLAGLMRAGDTVCLYGDLGAGKTTFVKGFATGFGLDEKEVASASFTIVAEYDTSPPLYHIDLYRLETPDHIEGAGIYEYLGTDGVAIVEWAERLGPDDVDDPVEVRISIVNDTDREIIIIGTDEEHWDNM